MSAAGRVVVLADDLSGAAELAGLAYQRGFSAEVQRRFDGSSSADVLAVDCDSRRLPEALAVDRVREIALQVAATSPVSIFKKVDSVLRGHVRPEIEAILAATGLSRALLMPANPSRARTITGGRYWINGVPLDQTEFAGDPEFPRASAELKTLFGQRGADPVYWLGSSDELPRKGIAIPDVGTLAELHQRTAEVDDATLPAGAADFFVAWLASRCAASAPVRQPAGHFQLVAPVLLACGSATAWPRREQECLAAGVPILTLDAGLTDDEIVAAVAGQLSAAGVLALASGSAAGGERGRELVARLAKVVARILGRARVGSLLAEGGATAAEICQHVGWTRFAVAEAATAGVGALEPIPGGATRRILIKPGSYAWPEDIWQSFCRPDSR